MSENSVLENVREEIAKWTGGDKAYERITPDNFIFVFQKCLIRRYLEEGIDSIDDKEIELLKALGAPGSLVTADIDFSEIENAIDNLRMVIERKIQSEG